MISHYLRVVTKPMSRPFGIMLIYYWLCPCGKLGQEPIARGDVAEGGEAGNTQVVIHKFEESNAPMLKKGLTSHYSRLQIITKGFVVFTVSGTLKGGQMLLFLLCLVFCCLQSVCFSLQRLLKQLNLVEGCERAELQVAVWGGM